MAPFRMAPLSTPQILASMHARSTAKYALELLVVGSICFGLAKLDLLLAPRARVPFPLQQHLVSPWLLYCCAGCVCGRRFLRHSWPPAHLP
jgi:hypothetical protein